MAVLARENSLQALRQAVRIEASGGLLPDADGVLGLGWRDIDNALGGGLLRGALHEIAPSSALHFGAAAGFAVALLACARDEFRKVLWIQSNLAELETGAPYGPGLDLFGLASERLLLLRVSRDIDALWAMEEALKCRALAAVLVELTEQSAADLTAMRRLILAAREGAGLGLLLRHVSSPYPSAAMTRWEIAAVPGLRDSYGGLGRLALALSLVRNRRGPTGRWIATWDHYERAFVSTALSFGVVEALPDQPDRAPLPLAG